MLGGAYQLELALRNDVTYYVRNDIYSSAFRIRKRSGPMPFALAPEAHAVLQVRLTPFSPYLVAIQAAEFAMMRGTMKDGMDFSEACMQRRIQMLLILLVP